jgi:hypothetical protein
MTIKHDHACCDGCPRRDRATTSIASERFERWERIPFQDGGEAHLCERCQERADRSRLAEEFVLECDCCGRNTVDNPELKAWRRVPGPPGSGKRSVSLCAECYEQRRS